MALDAEWSIVHMVGRPHEAWRQRALLPGEFKPGRAPSARFIVWPDGRPGHPDETPRCLGCDEVPRVQDLEPVEIATNKRGYLAVYRRNERDWPEVRTDTCWWCNVEGASGSPPLCSRCVEFLKKEWA